MKLGVFGKEGAYYVAWFDHEGEGGSVGIRSAGGPLSEIRHSLDRLLSSIKDRTIAGNRAAYDRFEYLMVEHEVATWVQSLPDGQVRSGPFGFMADSLQLAKEMLRVAKAATKKARHEYDSDVPYPDWAVRAAAAGWKPPKGWKP